MASRDLFGVVVRTAGLLMGVYGVSVVGAIVWRMLVLTIAGQPPRYRLVTLLLDTSYGAGWLLGGVLLMLSADRIVRFAYRGRRAGTCENCGYDLRGSPGRCPECGTTAIPPGSV